MAEDSTQSGELSPEKRESLWRNSAFNIFWFGQICSTFGDAFASIALPLLVLEATGSVAQMGLVTAIFSAGVVLTGIFAGVIVDRSEQRRLLLACDILRMLCYLLIPFTWWLVGPRLVILYLVTALVSCLGMLFRVGYMALVPRLVGSAYIAEANGRLEASYAFMSIVGTFLAGLVVSKFGAPGAIVIDALTFGLSALSLFFVRLRAARPIQQEEIEPSLWLRFLAGWRFLWQQPALRSITILLTLLSTLMAAVTDIFIFHIKHDLGQNDTTVGLVFALATIGAILAGLTMPFLRKRLGFATCWIGGNILNSLSLLLMGLAINLSWLVLIGICFMFTSTLASICSVSLRQEITPGPLLGRVTSAFWTIHYALAPLGAISTTWISECVGVPLAGVILGSLCLLISLSALLTPLRRY
ncbi:MFS transporter [Ktedonobacter sp. SOSP1-52]|uniref:MFS transporter n=1 Tax=Ktedonobacter sp. SOSP1-52 TaxID=2778366 RepID=UPI0019154522|nr:MFS transporter [Ktedonobacter sp. SOSP1-52]GHO69609.1 MFS transporter [Ktedonobacter sp. SOSP1-52]